MEVNLIEISFKNSRLKLRQVPYLRTAVALKKKFLNQHGKYEYIDMMML